MTAFFSPQLAKVSISNGRMLDIATTIVGVDEDELFYFKNKPAVDGIGESFRLTSIMKF